MYPASMPENCLINNEYQKFKLEFCPEKAYIVYDCIISFA